MRMPSAARQAARTSSGKVLPLFFRLASPISWLSNSRRRENLLFSRSRTETAAAQISGPMPSPGRTAMRIRPDLEAKARLRVVRENSAPRRFIGRPLAQQAQKARRGHLVGERQVRIVAAPDRPPRRRRDQRAGERYRVPESGIARKAIRAGELDPAGRMARMKIQELAEARLLDAVPGGEHTQVRDRERRSELLHRRDQFPRQPARGEEVEHPAELGAAGIEPFNARKNRARKTGFRLLDRVYVDADSAHAGGVHALELGIRDVLVYVDDAAAALRADRAHPVEHAGIGAAARARLDEDVALFAQVFTLTQKIINRPVRRLVTQNPHVRIPALRPEHVEVAIARPQEEPPRVS